MKKQILILLMTTIWSMNGFANGGFPFFTNFTSDTYHAHNRNFDIECDDYGNIYVANFEGLLYYDQAQWRIIHTPGISRITSLFKDSKGCIWVGGYNVFGYLGTGKNGMLNLKVLHSDTDTKLLGEVSAIEERDRHILFHTSGGNDYLVKGKQIIRLKTYKRTQKTDTSANAGHRINQKLSLDNGWDVYATAGNGLIIDEHDASGAYSLSEQNGLCSNNVNRIIYDGRGGLWGATDNGLFCINIPSVYTHFTASEGLKGEVTAINSIGNQLFVGTMQGLFIRRGRRFTHVANVTQACWQLEKSAGGNLFAATSDGLFVVNTSGAARINKFNTLSVYVIDANNFYTGELDGIYLNARGGRRMKISPIEKAKKILRDKDGTIWVETIFGQVYAKRRTDKTFIDVAQLGHLDKNDILTLFDDNGEIGILNSKGLMVWCDKSKCFRLNAIPHKEHFDNSPQFIYFDNKGRVWQTNSEGKELGVAANKKRIVSFDSWLHPMSGLTVNAMNADNNEIWIGGDFGLIHWKSNSTDEEYQHHPSIYIRTVILNKDSVIWGGYNSINGNLKPQISGKDIQFDSESRDISFIYSTDNASIFGNTEYRYRLAGYNDWSPWTAETSTDFNNLWYGSYEFQVMAKDKFGRITQMATYKFSIQYPLYLRWYSIVFYILLLLAFIMMIIRQRMRKLMKEKMHLEKIVEERTSELRQRNVEVEEKSHSLEKALEELGNAQNELIHQEKMATVGKLTKGLIDRILNPMNYINNFSHLSKGLVKDIEDDINEDKDKMTPDIYDDTLDVLSMVNSNLDKIEQHGINTTRILKAMEEMLKDRRGNMQQIHLSSLCSKIFEMTNSYHNEKIKKYDIKTELVNCPDDTVIEANAEQLQKTLLSLIDNSIYALIKKYEHNVYQPVLKMTIDSSDNKKVLIHIYDNGIGIESTIIDNIFDPFFTTKTTGEAAGVGLYLSREIILGFGGSISVQSEKNQYTEFLITLPLTKEEAQS